MKCTFRLTSVILCLLLSAVLAVPASAHGCCGGAHRHHGRNFQTCVTVCPFEDCAATGRHSHDGVTYCGYYHGDGVCNNNCLALCSLEDCTETGRHVHDGVTYCGYAHENGFCDGSCIFSGCWQVG